MSRRGVTFALTAFFVIIFGLVGCLTGCSRNSETATGSAGRPKVLRYAHMPAAEEMQDASLRVELLRKYLERELHMPVQLVQVAGYGPTIEAMRANKVDVATFGPFGYIIASEKAGAQAIVAAGDAQKHLGSYRSVIVVPKDSPLHSIADLKSHSRELVFLFTDPASTSGNLIPRAYLNSQGFDPEKDFKKVVYAGQQAAAALTVKAKKVDAGTMMERVLVRLQATGKLAPDDLRVIWTSEPIPTAPICVHKSLPEDFKEEIRRALLAIPEKDPVLWESTKKMYRRPDMTYVAVNDSVYDSLREFARHTKGIELTDDK